MSTPIPSDTLAAKGILEDTLMSGRIGIISNAIAKELDIEPLRALHLFYESETCMQLHDKNTGLYLYGDGYIADEFLLEMQAKQ